MKLKRCTQGIIAAFLILICSALTLDSPIIFTVSIFIGIFLIFRYHIFLQQLQSTARSVIISRKSQKSFIRLGSSTTIQTTLTIDIPEGVSSVYAEMIPAGMFAEEDKIHTIPLLSGKYQLPLSYQITPLIHGNILLPGGTLTIEDQFFCDSLSLTRKDYSGPIIQVQPVPFFGKEIIRAQSGDREVNQFRDLHGLGIRSYRDYIQNDDVRFIDWKLSAKSNSLIVREYMGLENHPPLIIVDLPDKDSEFNEIKFHELIRAVSGFLEKNTQEGTPVSLLLISGPNIMNVYVKEQGYVNFLEIIRDRFHPAVRLHSMYRYVPRSAIRNSLKEIQETLSSRIDDKTQDHLSRLKKIYHHHLLNSESNHFSIQISRILSSVIITDISLFSLCDGDLSYIMEISRQSRQRRIKFRIKTTETREKILFLPQNNRLRGEIIEGLL